MKKTIFLLLTTLLIASCAKKSTYEQAIQLLEESPKNSQEVITDFEKIISSATEMSNQEAHELMLQFEDYITEYGEKMSDSLNHALISSQSSDVINTIDSVAMQVESHGIALYMNEGYVEIEVSPKYISDLFKHFISETEYELSLLKQRELDDPSIMDEAVAVSYQEICDRLYYCDNLAVRHDTLFHNEIREYQKMYAMLLMYGVENTPSFDWQKRTIHTEVRNAMSNYIIERPNAISAPILKEYLTLLEASGYRESSATIEFINNYIKQ